ADGGTVVFVGRRGAYGNLVEINHGNGYITRYAHCSTINVKKGAKVYKGQVIAKVGNTGRSTGSHLHFEVLKNGSNKNPGSYVR
ncbi:MAG: M23 family metallopeptidase, partial [Tissierellia bacterium]|nr:M23 family metallopeptidase [Tissierellia bacterium]